MSVPEAIQLVEVATKATTAYHRPDLTARLGRTKERLADPAVRVLVVGEFKQGKSQLVNSLVSAPVCPVDDDIATSVVHRRPARGHAVGRPGPRRGRQRHAGAHPGRAQRPGEARLRGG